MAEKPKTCSHKAVAEEKPAKKITLSEAKKIADRLNAYSKKYEENTNLIRQITEEQQESYFTPKIGRPPAVLNTPEKSKLNYDFIKGPWKKILHINEGNSITASKSQSIFNFVKKRRYREIFNMLNPENEVIHIKNVRFDNIPKKLLDILLPVLEEMAEINEGLDYEEFSAALGNLAKTLSVTEKSVFYGIGKKNKEILSFTFQPKINSYSKLPAESFLERSNNFLRNKTEKIQKAKFDKEIELELSLRSIF